MREADLYPPVKAYLEAQGYAVKAEIGACDVMACRGEEPAIVVELKTGFTLPLVLQGVVRQKMFENVYLAVPVSKGWTQRYRDVILLCRRLGLGLLAIGPKGVEAHLDPGPYAHRLQKKPAARLLREFNKRVGDPNVGGTVGVKRVTVYRQDALRCAGVLLNGPQTTLAVRKVTGVARAATLMRDDHYGWFERVARGVYGLTPKGQAALKDLGPELAALQSAAATAPTAS